MNRKVNGSIAVKKGSDNVFADLKLSNPKERLAKAELAAAVSRLIGQLGLTQVEAAKRLGVEQPRVSALINGRLSLFSTDALLHYITALGRDVNISIGNGNRKRVGKVIVVCAA